MKFVDFIPIFVAGLSLMGVIITLVWNSWQQRTLAKIQAQNAEQGIYLEAKTSKWIHIQKMKFEQQVGLLGELWEKILDLKEKSTTTLNDVYEDSPDEYILAHSMTQMRQSFVTVKESTPSQDLFFMAIYCQ